MTAQQRLFRLAPVQMISSATHVPGEGWYYRCCVRRGDESWADAEEVVYSHLSTLELADVMCATAESWFLRL